MSKEKCRKNMSRVARSINVFRKSLKEQEAKRWKQYMNLPCQKATWIPQESCTGEAR